MTKRTVLGADFIETPFNKAVLYAPERYDTPMHEPSEALSTKDAYLLSESPFKGCPAGSRHFHCFYDVSSCTISSSSYWKHDLDYHYYDHLKGGSAGGANAVRVLHDVGLIGVTSTPAAPVRTLWGWPSDMWGEIVKVREGASGEIVKVREGASGEIRSLLAMVGL
jgi:hypothetical protein